MFRCYSSTKEKLEEGTGPIHMQPLYQKSEWVCLQGGWTRTRWLFPGLRAMDQGASNSNASQDEPPGSSPDENLDAGVCQWTDTRDILH